MNFNATLIIQVVSFLILFALLVKFLYRPFLDFMDKRSNKVKKWLDEAYDNREQAEERIKESERHLKEAKDQILKLRKQAEIQADEHRQGILKDAKEEADRIAEKSKEDMQRQISQAKQQLREEIGNLSVDIAEKILDKEIKKQDHKRLIEQFIDKLQDKK